MSTSQRVVALAFFALWSLLPARGTGAFLDPQLADFDGDGNVTVGESKTFELLLQILPPDHPIMTQVILAYASTLVSGSSPVDLSPVFQGVEAPTAPLQVDPCKDFIRGDANHDHSVNLTDVIYILNFILNPGSPPPDPLDSGDVDDNGRIQMTDAIWLQTWIFTPGAFVIG